MGVYTIITRKEAILYCKSFENIREDYPFHDNNWTLMRHRENKKIFTCIYEYQDNIWINTPGIATLCVTKVCTFTNAEIQTTRTDIFVSLLDKIKRGK